MVERLEKTFSQPIVNQDDLNSQTELQGLLCGVIQVLVTRLGKKFRPLADAIMTQLIRLFRSKKDGSYSEEGRGFLFDSSMFLNLTFSYAYYHRYCCSLRG